MLVLVWAEKWAAAGQPPLTEVHGWMRSTEDNLTYGRILEDQETAVCVRALLEWRSQDLLPMDF